MADDALSDLTVLVTRPEDQAPALVELLEARGARAVVMPLIEIVDLLDDEALARLQSALAALSVADWVVVASPNSASRMAPMLVGCAARVAAIGATTARRLPRVDFSPSVQNAAGLVAELPAGTGKVLIVQAAEGAPTLVDGLRAAGWTVERVDSHRAAPLVPSRQQQFDALRADALLLTSGSQARAWVAAFGTVTPPLVVAMGPQTADDAAGAGLKVDQIAADHSLAGTVEALVRAHQSLTTLRTTHDG